MRRTFVSALSFLVVLGTLPASAGEPDKAAEAFTSYQKKVPDTVKVFLQSSPWFVKDQKIRTASRDSAVSKGKEMPPLGEQAEVKSVRRTSTSEARVKVLLRLAEGEAVLEIWATFHDGTWTTTDLECTYSSSIKNREEIHFQARKLLLELDEISCK